MVRPMATCKPPRSGQFRIIGKGVSWTRESSLRRRLRTARRKHPRHVVRRSSVDEGLERTPSWLQSPSPVPLEKRGTGRPANAVGRGNSSSLVVTHCYVARPKTGSVAQRCQGFHARPAPSWLQLASVTPARVRSESAHVEMSPFAITSVRPARRTQLADILRATNSPLGTQRNTHSQDFNRH